jgi:hypothetical protein
LGNVEGSYDPSARSASASREPAPRLVSFGGVEKALDSFQAKIDRRCKRYFEMVPGACRMDQLHYATASKSARRAFKDRVKPSGLCPPGSSKKSFFNARVVDAALRVRVTKLALGRRRV